MTLFVVALSVAVVALIVLLDRCEKRMLEERKGWQLERANLIQRACAPQLAAMDHSAQQHQTSPGTVHAMSDEEAAAAEEAARVIAEMERAENEALGMRQL